MHKLVKQHVMYVWIAMLGVLFSALAPTISHAMVSAAQADEEVQVCTMEGMKTIVLAKAPSGKPVSPDHILKHCPYCATHGNMSSLLPTAQFVFALPALSSSHPPLFHQSATPLFAWTAVKPRGPPGPA
jgi:hypothetical protein